MRKSNDYINTQSAYIKWTLQAIHCFERNCNCEGCIIAMTIETQCKMKYLIPIILEKCGIPPMDKSEVM